MENPVLNKQTPEERKEEVRNHAVGFAKEKIVESLDSLINFKPTAEDLKKMGDEGAIKEIRTFIDKLEQDLAKARNMA